MEKYNLINYILDKLLYPDKWHWFGYHFQFYNVGEEHPFAASIVDACLDCEQEIEGFAEKFLKDLFSISGQEKYFPHYEQLMQNLAELLVIRQMIIYDWGSPVTFSWEPTAGKSKKNPELVIGIEEDKVGVEVKCPSLSNHACRRRANTIQVPARVPFLESVYSVAKEDGLEIILPRDNPVKDFLISANKKFREFKKEDNNFYGILVIVWDDHIFEPISSLMSKSSGLFTKRSFARDKNNDPLKFENVDAVILIRHLHQLVRSAGDDYVVDSIEHAMDYGKDGGFPPKVFVPNPHGITVPEVVRKAFQAYYPSPELGAEYVPGDMVFYFSLLRN